MSWQLWITLGVFLAFFVGLGAFDLWLLIFRGVDETISRQILAFSTRHPVVPYVIGLATGLLAGHIWWGNQ